ILVNEVEFGMNSKKLYQKLIEDGIMVRPFFKPISELPMYSDNNFKGKATQKLWEEGICLPSSVNLSAEVLNLIIKSIIKFKD
ncbi:MAG: DegT/DnrJ/EryC1/StrS family aminotransferase, partial [Bacillota bacterium]